MTQQHPTTEAIIDYLHRELTPEADAAMLTHLESCRDCAASYEEQAQLSEGLRAYARATERELPEGVVARIWDAVERESSAPSFVERLQALLRPVIAVPIAAMLVVGAFFAYNASHHVPLTTIDAAVYLRDHAAVTSTLPFGEGPDPASLRDDSPSEQQWVASTGTEFVAQAR
jgi:anti-sigma factor RsiW